jgi:membrane protein GlpM
MLLNILAGCCLVVAMTFLARTGWSWLNGLIPLFPTFALIGQTSTYLAKGDVAAKDVAFVGLFSLIPYAAYLLSIYFMSEKIGFPKAAAMGVSIWAVFAVIIVMVKTRFA